MSSNENAAPPLSFGTKVAYGFGQSASSTKDIGYHYVIIPFYTLALGVPGSIVGIAILVAMMLDAVSDPIMGQISDTFRSKKWGRRHLFMLIGAPLTAFAMYMLFAPPEAIHPSSAGHNMWMFVWIVAFAALARLCLTILHVPYFALGAELSDDYNERTSITTIRNFMGYLAGNGQFIFVFFIILAGTAEYPNGLLNPGAYQSVGVLAAIMIMIGPIICYLGTRDRIPYLAEAPLEREAWYMVFVEFWRALKLKSFRNLAFGQLCVAILAGVATAFVPVVTVYFWGLPNELMALTAFSTFLGLFIASPLAPALARLIDKKWLAVVGAVGFSGFVALPILARLFGIFTEEMGSPVLFKLTETLDINVTFAVVFINNIFVQIFVMFGIISITSMMADVVDEGELVYGRRKEGVYFAVVTAAQKFTFGVGAAVVGISLQLIGFPAQTDVADVPPDVITRLGILAGPMIAILAIIPAYFYATYNITKSRHDEIREELDARSAPASN